MPNDLEKFLQQAAERLAEKVNQGQRPKRGSPASPAQRPPRNVRQAERAPLQPEILDAEIVDADLLGPDPLSDLDTRHLSTPSANRPKLARQIGMADERMADHVKHVTDHDLVHLRDASSALSASGGETSVEKRDMDVSPLIKMLRQPDSLRAAFIVGEIFKRPYQ